MRSNPTEGRLGIAAPASAKACVRSVDLLCQIGKEHGEHWWDIAAEAALSSGGDWKRTERRHQEDAAIELMLVVRDLSPPVRQVVELRAMGLTWEQVQDALPKRAYFSIQDDWKAALKLLAERHDDLVGRVV